MSAFSHVLIIGAGTFGATTALELARLGHQVTIVDRSADGHASGNAASNDLNKIIRSDYGDQLYRDLGKKCIALWRSDPLYAPFYHEVGIIFRSGMPTGPHSVWIKEGVDFAGQPVMNAYEAASRETRPLARTITSNEEAKHAFPESLRPHLGEAFTTFGPGAQTGYFNPQAGWAEAGNATFAVLDEAKKLGVKVVSDALISKLLFTPGSNNKPRVCGAITSDGREFRADSVVIAAGSWTPSLLETLQVPLKEKVLRPSAHCVVTFQLFPEVAELFRGTPVTFNMDSGLYTFEPNADGILKCAIHKAGSPTPDPRDYNSTEYPRADDHEYVEVMTKELMTMYPILRLDGPNPTAKRLFTRICWYCDTADENFLIDFHPDVDGLLVASGDSGHGLKFMPMIGRLITSRLLHIDNNSSMVPDYGLSEYQRKVFSYQHHVHATLHDAKPIDSIRVGGEVVKPKL